MPTNAKRKGGNLDNNRRLHGHGISRRDFLSMAGGVVAGSALNLASAPWRAISKMEGESRPNILLIVTDQERYPQHWPAGWAEANLPNRQRLISQGISFRRACCASSMCSPSRASLLTGLYPAQHGLTETLTYDGERSHEETPLTPGVQTIGHMLASAGYRVILKGKWHVSKSADGGVPSSADVAEFGFHEWEPTTAGEAQAIEDYGGGCANWDEMIADQAISFLHSQTAATTSQTPFCLIVTLVNPHDVIAYPNDWDTESEPGCFNYADVDLDQGIGLPTSNSSDDLDSKPTSQKQSRDLYAAGLGNLLNQEERLNYVNFYAAMHKEVDAHIGRILDAISPDILDNTIIIYTSDHGELGLSHNGLRQKMFNAYEETINVPLIFANPQLFPAPQTTDAFASLVDLMPTLASLANIPDRQQWTFSGRDLTPVLTDPTASVQDAILFTFDDEHSGLADGMPINPLTGQPFVTQPNHIRAIRLQDNDGQWLYARYFDPSGNEPEQIEMYHLQDDAEQAVDPDEIDNLAYPGSPNYEDPFYVTKRSELAERLARTETERLMPVHDVYLPFINS